jgi:hypothetical protein
MIARSSEVAIVPALAPVRNAARLDREATR